MRCSNCDGREFTNTEYRMPGVRAPAVECTNCHVLHLSESTVFSDEDRESVKMAIAERARIVAEGRPTCYESNDPSLVTPDDSDWSLHSRMSRTPATFA